MAYLAAIIISLFLSAFFSGMEIAFISVNRLRIELHKKQQLFSSKIISVFINNPGKFLTTMLIGNNIALVIFSIAMVMLFVPLILKFVTIPVAVILILTLVITLLILFTSEFLPKILFRAEPNMALNIFAMPIMFFYILFFPLTYLISRISEKIIEGGHKNTNTADEANNIYNKVDLVNFINLSQDNSTEDTGNKNDLKLFQNALDFSSVKVRDCMIPRTEIVAVEINSPVSELKRKFIESDFSKILVYKESIDNITGYVTSKSLFKKFKTIKEKLIEVSYVPETMAASKLLESFIEEKKSMAVVVDEFGGVSGMLTIEDIIEEIFGEIEDEHDTSELIEKKVSDTEYILSGRLEVDYLNEKYYLKLPESEDYETLAGMVVHKFENIPKINEIILIEPFELKILKVTKTRIELVQLKIKPG
jgi:CBS domain containing-hemolysin-like protein